MLLILLGVRIWSASPGMHRQFRQLCRVLRTNLTYLLVFTVVCPGPTLQTIFYKYRLCYKQSVHHDSNKHDNTIFSNFQLLLQVGHRCEQQPYLKIKVRRLTHTPQSRLSHIVTMHAASGRAYPSCLLNIEIWIWVLIFYGWAGVPRI